MKVNQDLRKTRYISLKDGSSRMSGRRGFNVVPQSRSVQLAGKNWRWVWNRPTGILLQHGDQEKHLPIIDFTRIFQALFYGLSLLFLGLGFYNLLGKDQGNGYG